MEKSESINDEEWGINDKKIDKGHCSGTIFKRVKCDLNEVDEHAEEIDKKGY